MTTQRIWKMLGPIIFPALSLIITFLVIQNTAPVFDPTFNLLANRGSGKIIFTSLVILHIFLLIFTQSKLFKHQWLTTNIMFIQQHTWLKPFFTMFGIFFLLHASLLAIFFVLGYVNYNPAWGFFTVQLFLKIAFGFIATFFLAWTEELIFRGTLYPYFAQHFRPITSILITSIIFMFAHSLYNPLNLVTSHWRLGLGLFTLGTLLNIIFAITRKLYVGMGIHAGLVFVKVILRRMPLLIYLPENQWSWWFAKDLREAHVVHVLFLIAVFVLIVRYASYLFEKRRI